MQGWMVFIAVVYLFGLFLLAFFVEHFQKWGKKWIQHPTTYALSFGVYCTAWTFYGSVGRAAEYGIDFITIYLGPTLMAPLFWVVLRKMIRICRVHKIGTMADFIAARYGKDMYLGQLVTVFLLLGITPYIAIQLKSISSSLAVFHDSSAPSGIWFFQNPTFYITLICALIILFFSSGRQMYGGRNPGLTGVIAFESIIKLLAFGVLGVFVVFVWFDGWDHLFVAAKEIPNINELFSISQAGNYSHWFWMLLISFGAVVLLPRQFQVGIIENYSEVHLTRAMWFFPLYLLLINLFVMPVALAGKLLLAENAIPDMYVLLLPLHQNEIWLAALLFLGGFSAATGMLIVATLALSNMFSNNILLPYTLNSSRILGFFGEKIDYLPIYVKRLSVIIILTLAYTYFETLAGAYSLVSIGIISFAAVAQLIPAVYGALFWKKATKTAVYFSLSAGFVIWFYMLVFPTTIRAGWFDENILQHGLFGFSLLRPEALFGIDLGDALSNACFVSLSLNTLVFVGVSLFTKQSSVEHNQAEIFVDIFKYSALYEKSVAWKGTAYIPDIESLLGQFLGKEKTQQELQYFYKKYPDAGKGEQADATLVNFAEKLLTGHVGAASARILVANVAKEENFSVGEVMNMLKESQEFIFTNKALIQRTAELRKAKRQLEELYKTLQETDKLKDEFLYTVTHELRTPLTSIRALSEILHDNDDIEAAQRQHFLSTIVTETERMTRLISQVLDLEKYESGKQKLQAESFYLKDVLEYAESNFKEIAANSGAVLTVEVARNMRPLYADKDKIIQVVFNLLSNAITHGKTNEGKVHVSAYQIDDKQVVIIRDNGKGIPEEFQQLIFDKFFQAANQSRIKPKGSGLGLAISKQIVELHGGYIAVEKEPKGGARFSFSIPIVYPPKNLSQT